MGGVSSRKPYWVTAERWTDAKLNVVAAELAQKTSTPPSHCSREDRERFREFIFNISMSCLPEASSNYYWPDLHREVSKRLPDGQRRPSEPELTKFGRDLFEVTDKASLQTLRAHGIHHCFLALILEQAGIGRDRNRIIYEFLNWLVAARSSLGIGKNSEWSTHAVHTFMRSQPEASSHDITLLGGILARIGTELIALVAAIEARPDRVDIIEWPWSRLRDWWLTESGSDLDALTPSAATILLGWISKLSSTWKRSDIFRLCRVGRIDCHWPDGSSASSYEGPLELPLGIAKIRVGNAIQDVVVVDTDELSLAAILNLDRDFWQSVDDTFHCRTSDKPFIDSHPDFGSIRSVPVFANAWDRTPHIHYWGRRSKNYRPTTSATLRVPVRFKWRYDRLVAILGTIRTSVEDGGGYSLRIGSHKVWSGEIRNGYLTGWTSRPYGLDRLLATSETGLKVSLVRDDIVTAQETVPVWPLQDNAFLVCGTTVCSATTPIIRWMEPSGGNWRTSLMVRAPAGSILLSDVCETSRSDINVHGSPYVEVELAPSLGARALVQVGKQKWVVEYRNRLSLSYLPDREVVRGNISFVGAGNIRVIDRIQDAILRCDSPSSDSDLGLWLAADEMECFCRLESSTDKASAINVGRMAELNGLFVQAGELKATIGTPSGPGDVSFNFFIPPCHPSVEASQLGKPSRINLGIPAAAPLSMESDLPISLADAAESKFCLATIRGERWEVAARWKPDLVDVIVGDRPGAESRYRYKVFARRLLPTEVPCQVVLTHRSSATILFSGSEISIEAGQTCDLLPLIRSAMARQQVAAAPLIANSGDVRIEWVVDASPCVRHLVAEVASDVNGLLQVEVSVQLASLFPTELQLCIDCGDEAPSMRRFWTDPDTAFEERRKFSLTTRRPDAAESSLKIRVMNGHELIHISDLSIARPTVSPSVGEGIKQLVVAYRETGSTPYLTEILIAYLCNFEEASREHVLLGIANKIGTGANPESETALRLTLKMLVAMASGSAAYQALPSFLEVDPALSVLASSAWLLLSRRYAVAGLLNPTDFSRAATLAQSAYSLPDKRIRDFAILASGFARHVEKVEHLSTGTSWTTTDSASFDAGSDLHLSIGRLSSDVGTWLGN